MPKAIQKLGSSFRHACRGLSLLFRSQRNARIHLGVSICVLAGGILADISNIEWSMLVFAIGLVISAEALNTAIEILSDRITLESDPAIGRAKDVAAGAVLAAAACSIVLGLLVFVPHLLACLS